MPLRASSPCRPHCGRRPSAAGFTLVEVLVALMIMAILSAMAWQGVDGIVRARDISQAQLQRSLRLSTVMAQWDQDLASLFDTAAAPRLSYDGDTLRMVRRVDGGVQLVAWTHQGTQWWRWTGPVVTRVGDLQQSWLRSQQLTAGESGQLLMLDGVTNLEVQFFRDNAWSNPQSSGDVDPPTAGGGTAQRESTLYGVRLVLAFGDLRLTRDVALSLQQP